MSSPLPAINKDFRNSQARGRALLKLTTELVFIMLPLVVISFVLGVRGDWFKIATSSEWSFAACVLFGQAIVKLTLGCVTVGERVNIGLMTLTVALLIGLGVVPSSVILAQILDLENPSLFLIGAQWAWFIVSLICYYWFGGTGEHKLALREV